MKYARFFAMIVASTMAASCSNNLTYFTENLYDDFRWSDNELKQIQFYVSEDIYLYRNLEREDSVIENGEIKIREGQRVHEVVIKAGTPGVFVFSPKNNRLAISFENDNNNFLMFGPNKKANGKFVLLAKEWKKRGGVVTYGNETYVTDAGSAYSALMVNVKKASKVKYTKTTAEGRTVSN